MDKAAQHTKLRELIDYVAAFSPFYKKIFSDNKIDVQAIRTIDDLQKLPFTSKEDLQKNPKDFHCVPLTKFIDHVTTSGTTGKPLTLSLTDNDLDRLALNETNSFIIAGIQSHDIIQLMTTIDRRFMAGLAYFLGARKLGAGIIRVGNGLPELQWRTIIEMKPTVIICVPSFLVKLIQYAELNQIDLNSSSIKKAICIGEPIRNQDFSLNALGKKIKEKWQVDLYSTYASTEMATAFTECSSGNGGHVQEDLIIAEIIDEAGLPAKEGEPGELVVTPLGVEGMPLLRFRTGDIFRAHYTPCPCGRAGLRLGPLIGRKSQMIKYKGTSFYPAAIFEILQEITEIDNYQVHLSTGEVGTDEISINIGITGFENLIITKISDTFKARLRVVPKLNFLTPAEVNKMLHVAESRKPLLFVDKRRT